MNQITYANIVLANKTNICDNVKLSDKGQKINLSIATNIANIQINIK